MPYAPDDIEPNPHDPDILVILDGLPGAASDAFNRGCPADAPVEPRTAVSNPYVPADAYASLSQPVRCGVHTLWHVAYDQLAAYPDAAVTLERNAPVDVALHLPNLKALRGLFDCRPGFSRRHRTLVDVACYVPEETREVELTEMPLLERLRIVGTELKGDPGETKRLPLFLSNLPRLQTFQNTDQAWDNVRMYRLDNMTVCSALNTATLDIEECARLETLTCTVRDSLVVQKLPNLRTLELTLEGPQPQPPMVTLLDVPSLQTVHITGTLDLGRDNSRVIVRLRSLRTFRVTGGVRGRSKRLVHAFLRELINNNPNLSEMQFGAQVFNRASFAQLLQGDCVACWAMQKATYRVDTIGDKTVKAVQLYDVAHEWLPDLSGNHFLNVTSNFQAMLPVVLAVIVGSSQTRVSIVKALVALYALRIFTISVTVMPTSLGTPQDITMWNPFEASFGGTHDMLFSGHTTMAITGVWFLLRELAHSAAPGPLPMPVILLGIGYVLSCMTLILATRQHYTVDLVVATIACAAVLPAVS